MKVRKIIYKVLFLLVIASFKISAQPVPSHYYKILQKDSLYYLLTDKALFKFYSHGASGEFYLTRYLEGNFNSSTQLVLNDDYLFIITGNSIKYYSNHSAWDLTYVNTFVAPYPLTSMHGFGPYFFIRSGYYYNLLKVENGLAVPVEDSLFTHPSQQYVFFIYPYVVVGSLSSDATIYKYVENYDFYSVGQIPLGNVNTDATGDSLIGYFYWGWPPGDPYIFYSQLCVGVIEEPSFPYTEIEDWGLNIPQIHILVGTGTMIASQNLYYMMWTRAVVTKNQQLAYMVSPTDQVSITDYYIFLLGDSVRYSKWYAGSTFYPFTWTDVTAVKNQLVHPSEFILYQNYPNPFNPTTKIKYQISEPGKVKLVVYNVLGRETKILVNQEKPAGSYEIEFDGTSLPSGVYFYRIESGNYADTKKLILLK